MYWVRIEPWVNYELIEYHPIDYKLKEVDIWVLSDKTGLASDVTPKRLMMKNIFYLIALLIKGQNTERFYFKEFTQIVNILKTSLQLLNCENTLILSSLSDLIDACGI